MSRTFQVIPARPAFGNNNNNDITYASDLIKNKVALTNYCNTIRCKNTRNVKNQSALISIKRLENSSGLCCCNPPVMFNKANLNIGLFSKLDLTNVDTINTTEINPCFPFFYNYTIDPNGQLFGNGPCGVNNWTRYMVYNLPKAKR